MNKNNYSYPTLNKFIVNEKLKLKDCLKIIEKNENGMAFICNKNNKILGIITDGDIRRYLIKNNNLDCLVKKVMKKRFISLPSNSTPERIRKKLTHAIKLIPLVNKKQLVDIASHYRFRLLPLYEPYIKGNEQKYVNDAINSGWISSKGKYVKHFESIFCKSIGCKNALSTSSGTSALQLALLTLGIKNGDEVIVPNLTFAAVYNSVIFSGAKPIFVDINKKTLCINEDLIEKKITKKTKAIITVHSYGCISNMYKIMKLAKKYKLYVIEDCAHALGTYYKKKNAGLFGDASTFSFYGNKTISTGEGGMVVFKSKNNHKKADIIKNHGMSKVKPYWHDEYGLNFRMTNIQASIGVAQMEQFKEIIKRKKNISNYYTQKLSKISTVDLVVTPKGSINSHWLYTIILNNKSKISRDNLIKKFMHEGIEVKRLFFGADEMNLYKKYNIKNDNFPDSRIVSRNGICLPSFTGLNKDSLDKIITVIKRETI